MNQRQLVVQLGTNLLDKVQELGKAPWRLSGAGAIPGRVAPNGSDGAVLLRDGPREIAHEMSQLFGPVVGGGVYQFTCYCKAAGRKWVSLCLWDQGDGQGGARVWFDLENGTIGTSRLIGEGAARLHPSIIDVGDGWFRCGIACQVSLSASTGMFTAQIGLADADGNSVYAGDDKSGVLIWAPFVRYQPTANLLYAGETIGRRPWVLANAAARDRETLVSGDNASALLRESVRLGEHAVRQAVEHCASGLFLVFSCLAKPVGREWIRLALRVGQRGGSGLEAWFDLGNGKVGTARRLKGDLAPKSVITPQADGWYRCSLSGPWLPERSGVACVVQIALGQGEDKARYSGDGVSGVRLRNARLEAHARPR